MCEGVLTISKQEGRDIDLIPTDTSGPMTDTLSLRSRGSNEHFGLLQGLRKRRGGNCSESESSESLWRRSQPPTDL